jgi:hypothetical protein
MSTTALIFTSSLITTILGYIMRFQAFTRTSPIIIFFTFFLFGEAMTVFAFFITTFTQRVQTTVLVGIFVFILGLVIESFIFSNNYLGYIWWSKQTPSYLWKSKSKTFSNMIQMEPYYKYSTYQFLSSCPSSTSGNYFWI